MNISALILFFFFFIFFTKTFTIFLLNFIFKVKKKRKYSADLHHTLPKEGTGHGGTNELILKPFVSTDDSITDGSDLLSILRQLTPCCCTASDLHYTLLNEDPGHGGTNELILKPFVSIDDWISNGVDLLSIFSQVTPCSCTVHCRTYEPKTLIYGFASTLTLIE